MTDKAIAKKNIMKLEIDTSELSPAQIRLLKSIHSMASQVMTSENESDYFEGSTEVMRLCASMIMEANFSKNAKSRSAIPYAEQALEYSVSILEDYVSSKKVVNYDN